VKAGKAYISSLGTTGLLVASSMLLLVVVGALVAFDRWPTGASSGQADAIVIGAADDVTRFRAVSAERRRARMERRRAARVRSARRVARIRAARHDVQTEGGASALPGGPVISGYMPPDSGPGGGTGGAAGGGSPPRGSAGTPGSAPGTAGGGAPSGLVGDAVSGIQSDAGVGQAVGGVGGTADEALNTPLETVGPQVAP